MRLDWSVIIGSVIIVSALIGLVFGKIDAKDFITCVGLVLSFLSGKSVGYRMGRGEGG